MGKQHHLSKRKGYDQLVSAILQKTEKHKKIEKEELESKLQDLQNSVETLRNGYEELRRECYFILNWFNKELKAQRDEAFEIFNAEYKKKLELEKEVKDFEVYDDIHTSKQKKTSF